MESSNPYRFCLSGITKQQRAGVCGTGGTRVPQVRECLLPKIKPAEFEFEAEP